MSRRTTIAAFFVVGLAVGGCSNGTAVLEDLKEANYFSKPVINMPSWTAGPKSMELGPSGPVGPEDLVNTAGECAPAAPVAEPAAPPQAAAPAPAEAEAEPAPPAGKPQFGSLAGDLASAPMAPAPPSAQPPPRLASANPGDRLQPAGMPSAPPVLGGIALGMTECQTVRRAGHPNQVAIGAEGGERRTVVTYLSGQWPGIYTFMGGRLKVIDAVPEQAKPAKPQKQRRRAPARTAGSDRVSTR